MYMHIMQLYLIQTQLIIILTQKAGSQCEIIFFLLLTFTDFNQLNITIKFQHLRCTDICFSLKIITNLKTTESLTFKICNIT